MPAHEVEPLRWPARSDQENVNTQAEQQNLCRHIQTLDFRTDVWYYSSWRGIQEVASLGKDPENPYVDMETDSFQVIGGCDIDA